MFGTNINPRSNIAKIQKIQCYAHNTTSVYTKIMNGNLENANGHERNITIRPMCKAISGIRGIDQIGNKNKHDDKPMRRISRKTRMNENNAKISPLLTCKYRKWNKWKKQRWNHARNQRYDHKPQWNWHWNDNRRDGNMRNNDQSKWNI